MKQANVYVHGHLAGILEKEETGKYFFRYTPDYKGVPVSLTMPVEEISFSFDRFPPFFEGLLPEGNQLEGLLRLRKIDRSDYFRQLLAVGNDMVGAVTVSEVS